MKVGFLFVCLVFNLNIQQCIPHLTLKDWHVQLLKHLSLTYFSRNLKG